MPHVERRESFLQAVAIHGRRVRDISVRITIRFFEANRWMAYLRIPEIDEIKTVPHLPLSNPPIVHVVNNGRVP